MKKIVSIILSLTLLGGTVFAAPSGIPYSERSLTVNADGINAAVSALKTDLKKANNRDKVFEDYYTLLNLASENGDVSQINMAETEKLNYGVNTEYSREFVNENIENAVKYGQDIKLAVKSILDSRYAKDFSDYWGEERTAHIAAMRDNTDTTMESKSFYDRYFELLDKNADSLEFAKLLRELVIKNNSSIEDNPDYDNYLDYLYAESNAGFTVNDVEKYFEAVVNDYYYYVNKFKNYGNAYGIGTVSGNTEVSDPLKALAYVKKLNPRFGEAYDYLVNNGLFFYGAGERQRGATIPMYSYGDAGILVSGNSSPMTTLIHEFGHYQSFLNSKLTSEDLFFGEQYGSDLQELNSQAFELISTDYYEDIYGENAAGMRFQIIVQLMQQLAGTAEPALVETALYSGNMANKSAEELDEFLTSCFGSEWYKRCPYYFNDTGIYIEYSIALFDAIQIYDLYLRNKQAGIDKYLEACSYESGSYTEITKKLGLVSAFDDNAGEYLQSITENIFKTKYGIDYETALDYFENGTYLGRVAPTTQRVSVNGGEARTLTAYNSSGFNYIRIRDLAYLLSGTEMQFDVEYDTEKYTVNIIPNRPYTPDGTEMKETEAVETAGQKNHGTFMLMYDGKPVSPDGAMFINGWNCYRLRGLTETGILDFDIDYDTESDTVFISTK